MNPSANIPRSIIARSPTKRSVANHMNRKIMNTHYGPLETPTGFQRKRKNKHRSIIYGHISYKCQNMKGNEMKI